MPAQGARKTVGGVTGEWDGATWRRVEADAPAPDHAAAAAPAPEAAGPAVGDRKTKGGVTGEWTGSTWRRVEDEAPAPDNAITKAAGGTAALAAALPAARGLAERIAESPYAAKVAEAAGGRGGALLGPLAAAAGPLYQGYQALTGKKSPTAALRDGIGTEVGRQVTKRLPSLAGRVASSLGGNLAIYGEAAPLGLSGASAAGPVAGAGALLPVSAGLLGVAGSAGFLGALQHDANRKVTIDYSQEGALDTAIARTFSNMRDSEKHRGRSLAERRGDPDDVMFRPNDAGNSVTVTPQGGPPSSPGILQRLALMAGLGGRS